MNTENFIIELFCRVDDQMLDVPKHPQAALFPNEVVTLASLFALKGVGNRAFYRWLKRDYGHLFPACRTGRACFGCSTAIGSGFSASWPHPRCWG
jgi:hypothetical protein